MLVALVAPHTAKQDFDGNGAADFLWRNANGDYATWLMAPDGRMIAGAYITPATELAGDLTFRVSGNWGGLGIAGQLWQDAAGHVQVWYFGTDGRHSSTTVLQGASGPILATGDFNGDGRDDLLVGSAGVTVSGSRTPDDRHIPPQGVGPLDQRVGLEWGLVGVGDFNGDGRDDLLFRGEGGILLDLINTRPMQTGAMNSTQLSVLDPGPEWQISALGDFDGDGKADLFWQRSDGLTAMWLMDGGAIREGHFLANTGPGWTAVGADDFNGDGHSDIAWRHADGTVATWLMDGPAIQGVGMLMLIPNDWTLVSV